MMTARYPLLPTTESTGGSVAVDKAQLPLLILFVASLVLLIATGTTFCLGGGSAHYDYTICVLVLSFIHLVLTKSSSEDDPPLMTMARNKLLVWCKPQWPTKGAWAGGT